jgi:lysophospholipase L1-like esterase
MRKLLIFTDSLSLPRSHPEVVTHPETWPEMLRKEGFEVCLSAIGGATLKDLEKQLFYFQKDRYFDAVIVQSGIVDCAPRFVKKWELKALQSIPMLGGKILSLLNKNGVRKARKITYNAPEAFLQSIRTFENSFTCPVVFLGILPATEAYENTLPGITKNIDTYNQILSSAKHFVSLNAIPSEGIMSDHHHLNPKGHQFVKEKVCEKLIICATRT